MEEHETVDKAYIQFINETIRNAGLKLFESFLRLELSLYFISSELSNRDYLGIFSGMDDKKLEILFIAYANDQIKFKEGYKPISEMEAIAGLFHWKYKRKFGDEAYEKEHSKFVKYMPRELAKFIESIDIKDRKSLDKVRLYCRFASNLFIKIPLEEDPFGIFPIITYQNDGLIQLFATASQMVGYWKARIERMRSIMAGGKATAMGREERIKKLFDFLKETGTPGEDGIKVDRNDWETFFTRDLEIYTDKTKREYKKLIEKQLKEESGKDLKIKI